MVHLILTKASIIGKAGKMGAHTGSNKSYERILIEFNPGNCEHNEKKALHFSNQTVLAFMYLCIFIHHHYHG